MRIKRSVNALKKRRKIMRLAKGYFGSKSRSYRIAREAVMKSQMYAFIGRRRKKRDFRQTLDREDQCRGETERSFVQQIYARTQSLRHRPQQKGARGHCGDRQRHVCQARGKGEGCEIIDKTEADRLLFLV